MRSFHVRIQAIDGTAGYLVNLSKEDLEKRVLDPWRTGTPIVASGTQFHPVLDRVRIDIVEGPSGLGNGYSDAVFHYAAQVGQVVTDALLTEPAGTEAKSTEDPRASGADPRKIMVVHGRDWAARNGLFEFLRALDLRPLEWSELVSRTEAETPYVGEVLDQAFAEAQAVVVLMTPDDEARLAPRLHGPMRDGDDVELRGQPRPNVFFEAGLAFGRQPYRTILVELGVIRQASDLMGRHTVRVSVDPEWRHALVRRLISAGCDVNTEGTDWLSAGQLELAQGPDATKGGV